MHQAWSRNATTLESRNPATGEVLGSVPVDSARTVDEKVERARVASQAWSGLSFVQRFEELTRWRRELAARADDIADLIHRECGKPRLDALGEILLALGHLEHAARRAGRALAPRRVSSGLLANFRSTVSYHPLGVVAVIGPWNYPIFTPMGAISSALAAGNTVVFKPSELTPLVGEILVETARRTLSIPDVLVLTTGEAATGAALAGAAVDKIAFTGSSATGRKIMRAAAERLTPVVLELGGNDAMIVAADADVDDAAAAAVWGAMGNAGQTCIGVERCYVHTSIYERFVDQVVDEARSLTVGVTDDAQIGPMTSAAQVDIVRRQLEDAVGKGARILCGGVESIHGSFIEPTVVVDVTSEMVLMRDETFGPVLPVQRVDSVDEAVLAANASAMALGSAVFGKKGVRGVAGRLRAGMTAINSVLAYAAIPGLPFGGVGESGFGRIHGDEGLREFSRVKATAEQRVALPVNLLSFHVPGDRHATLRRVVRQLYGGGLVDKATSAWSSLRGRG